VALPRGEAVPGPALLEDPTSTLLVPPGWTARRDASDNMILTREASLG
jgi:N-methylhydantoinase A